ncbi:MAG: CDP-2,3-bis-(O-geranylgeranyl)-sn-glycerol synthase [Candidatus Woesearchaeota archaeon]
MMFFKLFFLGILQAVWFLLPAYVANSAPVVVYKINFLNVPVDFNKKYKGKPIFGTHKTWRGLFFGVLFGMIVAYLQKILYYNVDFFRAISVYDYSNAILFGFLISIGALVGDLVKSFFKRRISIPEGADWPFFDQYDFVIGSLVFVWSFYPKDLYFLLGCFIMSPILHILANLTKPFFMKTSEKVKNNKNKKNPKRKIYF